MDNISQSTLKKYREQLEGSVLDLELEVRTLRTFMVDPDFISQKEAMEKSLDAAQDALKFSTKKLEILSAIDGKEAT